MSNEEVEKTDPGEAFPEFERLSDIGREIGDAQARTQFSELVVSSGELSSESLAVFGQFVEGVKAETGADAEKAVDEHEKHALQVREQILHELAAIILLLDTRNDAEDAGKMELAKELNEKAYDRMGYFAAMMQGVLSDQSLIHREYFEKILQKVTDFLGY